MESIFGRNKSKLYELLFSSELPFEDSVSLKTYIIIIQGRHLVEMVKGIFSH